KHTACIEKDTSVISLTNNFQREDSLQVVIAAAQCRGAFVPTLLFNKATKAWMHRHTTHAEN
ncbi:MAG: hypothetical protein LBD15_02675, partial [Holosporales bacterium]|nr:hypothetical protein [Holosporales bacterium]